MIEEFTHTIRLDPLSSGGSLRSGGTTIIDNGMLPLSVECGGHLGFVGRFRWMEDEGHFFSA